MTFHAAHRLASNYEALVNAVLIRVFIVAAVAAETLAGRV